MRNMIISCCKIVTLLWFHTFHIHNKYRRLNKLRFVQWPRNWSISKLYHLVFVKLVKKREMSNFNAISIHLKEVKLLKLSKDEYLHCGFMLYNWFSLCYKLFKSIEWIGVKKVDVSLNAWTSKYKMHCATQVWPDLNHFKLHFTGNVKKSALMPLIMKLLQNWQLHTTCHSAAWMMELNLDFEERGLPSVFTWSPVYQCVVPVVTSGASVHMNEYQNLGANIKLSPWNFLENHTIACCSSGH